MLIGRYGYRLVLAASLLLLGAPAVALTASAAAPVVLVLCLLRGAGLGVFFVAGAALVAELVPVGRRSEGMGLYGAFVGVPGILFLPLGVWLSGPLGPRPVFLLGAVFALAALFAIRRVPASRSAAEQAPKAAGTGGARLLGPALVFGATALAGGVLPTFLPLSVPGDGHRWVALGLLVQSCTTPLARWAAGRYGRGDGAALLPAAIVLAAAGLLGAVWADRPALLIAGLAVFGVGFGAAQNVTLMLMLSRASAADPVAGVRRASMLWNATYDIAMGVGAVAFGMLVDTIGDRTGFVVLTILIVAVLPLAWRQLRSADGVSA
jgi:MFS family permease